jgi:hypothetical protein
LSCDGCETTGTVVTCAACGDGHGGNPSSSLDFSQCVSEVSNCWGKLSCDGQGCPSGGGGGGRGGCTSDSQCSGECSGDCYQCLSGSCSCGYVGVSGSCIY